MHILSPIDGNINAHTPLIAAHDGESDGVATRRVLVIDDEMLIADTIVQILNKSGFQAKAAYNGKDAIEYAKTYRPATILSDVLMPQLDGVETAIAIRKQLPDIRIVLFSGQSATVEILERARALGYDFELLPKPIHPTELLRHLRAS
jgi:CheY-like chemotaxis protein